jgi:hypothetical protein
LSLLPICLYLFEPVNSVRRTLKFMKLPVLGRILWDCASMAGGRWQVGAVRAATGLGIGIGRYFLQVGDARVGAGSGRERISRPALCHMSYVICHMSYCPRIRMPYTVCRMPYAVPYSLQSTVRIQSAQDIRHTT